MHSAVPTWNVQRGHGAKGAFADPTSIATSIVALLLASALTTSAPAQPAPPPAAPAQPAPAQTQARQRITIGYVDIEGDPRYEPVRAYERLILKTRGHPFPGAEIGIDEAQVLVRVLNTEFALERITVKAPDQVAAAVTGAMERGIKFFLIDAPAEAFKPLAAAVKGRDALLFNVSAPDDWLRRDLCSRELVHTIPSLAMSMDGLVQYLMSHKWKDMLVFEGPLPVDTQRTDAFARSVQKFGGRIVARQHFKPGTDPRDREQNNPALLSAVNRDYDVVFVADDAFDFARTVPYHTVRSRPVVGSIDLEPVAWHWTWEHNGAPQVNSRFEKKSGGRRMDSADFAAWIAVKMIVQSALRTRSADFAKQRDFILGDSGFDGDKGLPVGVRPWDHQVRQAVLLAAPYMVVASAPLEGFLHRINDLDTLGDDEPETPCHLNK